MADTRHAVKESKEQVPSGSIAIIGCGNMGAAIAERLAPSERIYLYDHHTQKAQDLAERGYGKMCPTLFDALEEAAVVILAVKPQNLAECAQAMKGALNGKYSLISLLAGTSLSRLRSHFPHAHVLRMMPNISLLCGEGSIALCSEEADCCYLQSQMGSRLDPLGEVLWLPESKMDAFTALAGSGPAFIFALTEAMVDAAIAMGFTSKEAQKICNQLLRGSAALMATAGKHPGELKWKVTSPAGTTIAGLIAFEENGVRNGIIKTFLAAYRRSIEL